MRPVIVSVLTALLAGCTVPSPECEGTFDDAVANIVDGDTLDGVSCGRLRLALVDAPELGEPGHAEASAFVERTCPLASTITVDLDAGQPTDATGTRLVAVVFCGATNLNAALLAEGHAVILTSFCDRSEFADDAWARGACRT